MIQWKPLFVITLGLREIDNIKQMIQTRPVNLYNVEQMGPMKSDHKKDDNINCDNIKRLAL